MAHVKEKKVANFLSEIRIFQLSVDSQNIKDLWESTVSVVTFQ